MCDNAPQIAVTRASDFAAHASALLLAFRIPHVATILALAPRHLAALGGDDAVLDCEA